MQGWVKLYRSLLESDLWTGEKFTRGQAWVDLILLANHADREVMFNGAVVLVRRGQYLTSIRKLSARWGWGKDKTRNFLARLETANKIHRSDDTSRTLLTLVNYGLFQGGEDTEQTQTLPKDSRKPDPNKKKEDRKEKTNIFIPPSREEVENYFREKGYSSDSHAFYEYYSAGEWTKSDGAPLKNWQRAAAGWENNFKRWQGARKKGSDANVNRTSEQRKAYISEFG